jgi:hypothetical protein
MGVELDEEHEITLEYDFVGDTFSILNDPNRFMILDQKNSSVSYETVGHLYNATVMFYFDFNFNWERRDHVDLNFLLKGYKAKKSIADIENAFRVVTDVGLEGNITVIDEKSKDLSDGDWVRGGSTIVFSNITRKYSDPSIPVNFQPPSWIKIGIVDRTGMIFFVESGDLDEVEAYIQTYYLEMEFKLVLLGISVENLGIEDRNFYEGYSLSVQIDSDRPGLPGDLQIRPDSKDDQPQNYDDDTEIFLVWKDAIDQSSGIANYHISINKDKDEARATGAEIITLPRGSDAAFVEGLPEGVNTIYIWAEDQVGNEGNAIFVKLKIDLTPVWYSDFYPSTGAWINTIRPRCTILLHDDLTGVNPESIQYEISTTGEVGLVGDWVNVYDPYAPDEELRVVVSGWFKNGKDNWIRFRSGI